MNPVKEAMGTILHEIRLAFRKLLRDPFLSGVSVLALMLGIGLTASMYSIAYSVLVRGMPFENPDELLAVTRTFLETGGNADITTFQDFQDWKRGQSTFAHFGAWTAGSRELVDGEDRPVRISVTYFSPDMLPLLGESPVMGRGFGPQDIGPDASVVLLSGRLWQTRYGHDPGILGKTLKLDGREFTIIGVMAPAFAFPDDQELFLPLPYNTENTTRESGYVRVLGRLPQGASEALAQAEIQTIAARLTKDFPDTNQPVRIDLVPLVRTFLGSDDAALLWTMVVASFFVLLIACANVANLLAARALDRSGDVAVAAALGAGSGRIIRELLLEALVLALVGAALGAGLAAFGVDWFDGAMGPQKPIWITFQVDGPILLFILLASLASALVSGLAPAFRSASVSVRESLQDESRGASSRQLGRLSRGMVIFTITLAFPLLAGAGLLIASFQETNKDIVAEADQILAVQLSLSTRRYPDAAGWRSFWNDLLGWAEGRPAVSAVSWADWIPPGGARQWSIELEGDQYLREDDRPWVRAGVVRPGFFRALGVNPIRGRGFEDGDRTGPPVVIINQPLADRFFSGVDPLGRRLRIHELDEDPWREIVGVVPDMRMNGTSQTRPEGLFIPSPPEDENYGYLLMRSAGDPSLLTPTLRDYLQTVDPEMPIRRVETLEDRADQVFWFVSVLGSIFSAFGLAALFMASVGLYGIVAHSVSRRTREVGIRMALGATPASVFWLFLRDGMSQVGVGLALGAVLALWGTRLLASVLFGVQAGDIRVLLGVAAVLTLSTVAAIMAPTLRATRSSPVEALRGE